MFDPSRPHLRPIAISELMTRARTRAFRGRILSDRRHYIGNRFWCICGQQSPFGRCVRFDHECRSVVTFVESGYQAWSRRGGFQGIYPVFDGFTHTLTVAANSRNLMVFSESNHILENQEVVGSGASTTVCARPPAFKGPLSSRDGQRLQMGQLCFAACGSSIRPGDHNLSRRPSTLPDASIVPRTTSATPKCSPVAENTSKCADGP